MKEMRRMREAGRKDSIRRRKLKGERMDKYRTE